MSLFRTLQNSPAVVSIFHNSKLPKSAAMCEVLKKASRKLNGDKTQFEVNLMVDKIPTYDQFKFLVSQCTSGNGKEVISHAFPFMSDRKKVQAGRSVTEKSPIGLAQIQAFTEGEYAIIQEAFEHLLKDRDEHPEHDPSQVFSAPLVVDWDQGLVAGDESSLEHLLAKYNNNVAA